MVLLSFPTILLPHLVAIHWLQTTFQRWGLLKIKLFHVTSADWQWFCLEGYQPQRYVVVRFLWSARTMWQRFIASHCRLESCEQHPTCLWVVFGLFELFRIHSRITSRLNLSVVIWVVGGCCIRTIVSTVRHACGSLSTCLCLSVHSWWRSKTEGKESEQDVLWIHVLLLTFDLGLATSHFGTWPCGHLRPYSFRFYGDHPPWLRTFWLLMEVLLLACTAYWCASATLAVLDGFLLRLPEDAPLAG
jgi:hypothetical protein